MSSLEKCLFGSIVHILTGMQEWEITRVVLLGQEKPGFRQHWPLRKNLAEKGSRQELSWSGQLNPCIHHSVNESSFLYRNNFVCYVLCVHTYVPSCVQLFATQWKVANQAPLSMKFSRQRILGWVAMSYSRESSWSRDQTHVCCIARRILYHCTTYF